MIGISTLIEPVAGMPQIVSEPQPCCQTMTIRPQAAATDSRFRSTAFSGRTIDRNARASSRKVRPAMRAMTSGKLPYTASRKSALCAACPPVTTSASAMSPVASRMRSSVSRPAGELPSAVGMTVTRAVPSRRHARGATVPPTPSTRASAAATASGSPVRTTASNGDSGPVPSPEPLSCCRPARAGPDWPRASACGVPSWIVVAANARAPRATTETASAAQRRRTTKRAHAVQPRLGWSSRRA